MASFPENWLRSELLNILGFEPDEIIQYIKSLSDRDEQKAHLLDMLDTNDPKHLNFIQEFVKRTNSTAKIAALAPPGMVAYKKRDDEFNANGARPKSKASKADNSNKENQGSDVRNESKKGGGKFVPLFAKDGKIDESVMILPGRNKCECQAQKHDLINNCIKCGRIVCKQEGSGPCLFCGHLVCTKDELEVLNRGSKKSDQLMKKLLSKAEIHKNTLLEYDKTSEKRTKVIDDESDYFSVDSDKWLSQEQRQKLKEREKEIWEQRHGSRLNKKYTFDFAGRRIKEDETFDAANYDPSQDDKVKKILDDEKIISFTKGTSLDLSLVAHPDVPRPTFLHKDNPKDHQTPSKQDPNYGKHILRIQDAQLQEMRDDGWCLSMHQPWASYLVSGIKIHEGRNWYSPHRGRLWIHAASKVPGDDEIAALQKFYEERNQGQKIDFPKNLPVSCLLGCVDVVDVLAQEEYRERFPQGESSSPFVFVCSNPQELMIKFPMSGQHKIYKLDQNIHNAAKKSAKKAFN